MILLDSDHLSILFDERHTKRRSLLVRLESAIDQIAIPVVAVEEHLRGWLALIRRQKDIRQQIYPYSRLSRLVELLSAWDIAAWNEEAAEWFDHCRAAKIRIGSEDLKIASTALANSALLLSSNLRDFEKVPGLSIENWL